MRLCIVLCDALIDVSFSAKMEAERLLMRLSDVVGAAVVTEAEQNPLQCCSIRLRQWILGEDGAKFCQGYGALEAGDVLYRSLGDKICECGGDGKVIRLRRAEGKDTLLYARAAICAE